MKYQFDEALDCLKKGGVLLCPTDTIWGLSCDATNEQAVQKITALKQRSTEKSFIILVNSLDMMGLYIDSFPPFAVDLIELSDKPLTVIFPKGVKLAPSVINTDGSVAMRFVNSSHEEAQFCNQLIRKFNKPIVSTSANLSGEPSPRYYSEIDPVLREGVDYQVPYFRDSHTPRKPSGIIKLNEDGTFKVIRS
jgi:L-threonylcarbamoyladenylate synthase